MQRRWSATFGADCVRMRRMLGHGAKFGRKKEEAIAALLTQRNVEEAAKSIGIVPNTLLRWLQVPEFQAAYREARRGLLTIDRSAPTRIECSCDNSHESHA